MYDAKGPFKQSMEHSELIQNSLFGLVVSKATTLTQKAGHLQWTTIRDDFKHILLLRDSLGAKSLLFALSLPQFYVTNFCYNLS